MNPFSATIFIVDDDVSVRRAMGRVMTSAGMNAETYESDAQFLALADLTKKGFIVADITLPGTGGLELKSRLDATPRNLPLIFLTAQDTAKLRTAARELGAKGFFRKPVDTQALLDAIDWALRQNPASREIPQP